MRNRTWIFNDQEGEHRMTEEEILKEYYPYWAEQMERIGKQELINHAHCIDDWVVVHMAWESEKVAQSGGDRSTLIG